MTPTMKDFTTKHTVLTGSFSCEDCGLDFRAFLHRPESCRALEEGEKIEEKSPTERYLDFVFQIKQTLDANAREAMKNWPDVVSGLPLPIIHKDLFFDLKAIQDSNWLAYLNGLPHHHVNKTPDKELPEPL
jgi:hypothetical protein